jgi:hypothetical protein
MWSDDPSRALSIRPRLLRSSSSRKGARQLRCDVDDVMSFHRAQAAAMPHFFPQADVLKQGLQRAR